MTIVVPSDCTNMQQSSTEEQVQVVPKILVVDDNFSNILVIEGILKPLNIELDRAFSGEEALEKIKDNEYAIVLLDVQMPEMDGFTAAELIRKEPKNELLTIIFVSAVYNQNYFLQKGLQSGAVDFITKPFDRNAFIGKIKIFLKLYQQRKQLELQNEKIKNTHQSFVELFNNSPDAIYIENEEGYIIDANKTACQLHGFTDLKGKKVSDLVPETMKSELLSTFHQWFNGELSHIESKIVTKSGEEKPVEIRGTIIDYENRPALLASVRDVSDRELIHQLAVEREKKFRTLFEKIPTVAVFGLNEKLEIIYWNRACKNFFGYSMEDVIRSRVVDILFSENDQEIFKKTTENLLKGKELSKTRNYKLKRKDGSVIPVLSSFVVLENVNKEKEIYCIDIDLSEREKVRTLQESRMQLVEFINQISSRFINIELGDIDQSINKALETVSSFAGVECSYIYQLDESGQVLERSNYWCMENQETEERFEVGKIADLDEFIKEISDNGIEIFPGNDKKSCMGEAVRKMNIHAFVHIPIYVDQLFIGIIGFGTANKERNWTDQQIYAFKLISQVVINVLERKTTEERFLKTHKKAKESDTLKTAFLANMSHEIRTPMNAILGFSSLLNDPENTPQETELYVNHITTNGHSLMNIINEILEISKLESGQVELKKIDISLEELIEDIVEHLNKHKVFQNKKSLTIRSKYSGIEKSKKIYTDKIRTQQVIKILAENALKYTKQGSIEIGVENIPGGQLQFYVKDTGIGIPIEKQQLIFDRFRQVEESHTKEFGGFGLGLTIARHLVNMMGGEIWVESEPNIGSTFIFSLGDTQKQNMSEENVSSPKAEESFLYSGKSILIAEDVEANFELMEVLLKRTGIKIYWAKDGAEAIKIFTWNKNIDLIFMDIQMPIMNGYEATKKVRELNSDIPVIALTAYSQSEDQNKMQEAGCNDYLLKPIKQTELLAKIQQYIS